MRFEAERMMAHVRALDFSRIAGTGAERRAADYVATQLESSGLKLERQHVAGSWFPAKVGTRLGWVAVGIMMTLQTMLARQGSALAAGVAMELVALLCCLAAGTNALRFGRRLPPCVSSQNVLAYRPMACSAASCLVFIAPLDSPPRRWGFPTRSIVTLVMLGLLVFLGDANTGGPLHVAREASPVLLALLWLVVFIRACEGIDRRRAAVTGDNRTGLAALLELARTLPPRCYEHVEARFVAAGAQELDLAGVRALLRRIESERSARPGLVVNLQAPFARKTLFLIGRGHALELAEAAARGLWIPYRIVPRRWVDSDLRGSLFERSGFSYVCLLGDTGSGSSSLSPHPATQAETDESLAPLSAVQLATEIALRWAREVREADHGDNLARSSQ